MTEIQAAIMVARDAWTEAEPCPDVDAVRLARARRAYADAVAMIVVWLDARRQPDPPRVIEARIHVTLTAVQWTSPTQGVVTWGVRCPWPRVTFRFSK